jgi:hypothetical protein
MSPWYDSFHSTNSESYPDTQLDLDIRISGQGTLTGGSGR